VVLRQGKHVVIGNGSRILTIPRHNPVNAITMGGVVRDAGVHERVLPLGRKYHLKADNPAPV